MSVKPMTVGELRYYLGKFDQSLPVAYGLYSESCLLESSDIEVKNLCEPRPDGWVANYRPDKSSIEYLVFPGN